MQAKRWMHHLASSSRGFRLPVLLVIVILLLDFLPHQYGLRLWPLVRWRMYFMPGPRGETVTWRRFMMRQDDGTEQTTTLNPPFPFLEKAHRVDDIISRDYAGFMVTALRRIRKTQPAVNALTFENREWNHVTSTLDEHLQKDAPISLYRAAVVPPVPPAPRSRSRRASIILNGDFSAWTPGGIPKHWSEKNGSWFGVGIDIATRNRSVSLLSVPAGQKLDPANRRWRSPVLHQTVVVQLTPDAARLQLRLVARSLGPDAKVYLRIDEGGAEFREAVGAVEPDGPWKPLELTVDVPSRIGPLNVLVGLLGPTASEAYFDDVELTLERRAAP